MSKQKRNLAPKVQQQNSALQQTHPHRFKTKAKRDYKDSVFRMIYSDRKNACELHNGLTSLKVSPEDIVIEKSIGLFIRPLRHDVAIRVGDKRFLIGEEQSTPNANMPVRILIYIAELYDRYIRSISKNAIYQKKQLPLPTPYFYVILLGNAEDPPMWHQRLSEAFSDKNEVNLELVVTVYNINSKDECTLLNKCPLLKGYKELVDRVESRRNAVGLDMAIKEAIDYCKKHTELRDFLLKQENEVIANMLWEWNEDEARRVYGEEQREEGREEGRAEGRAEGERNGRLSALLDSVKCLMDALKYSVDEAMDTLKIPVSERDAIKSAL